MTTTAILRLAILSALAAPSIAHAELETCSFAVLDAAGDPTYDVQKVEYFHAPPNYNTYAYRCDWNTGRCSMSGWLISKKKLPAGQQPTIVFAHGSGGGGYELQLDNQSLTVYSCPIKKFVDAGYVVYMPYRRGTFDVTSAATLPHAARGLAGWSNSGWAAQDWAVWNVQSQGATENTDNYDHSYIYYLQQEADDLVMVLNRLTSYKRPDMTTKLVDPDRVAIVGHSMGGALVTFASTDDNLYTQTDAGPQAFISLSGAAMSYHESHWWHDVLTSSAAINNAPLFFTRVLDEDARTPNDYASAREPFAETGNGADGSGEALFTNANATCANDTVYHCNHAAFATNANQISRWFPYVKSFLHDVGM